MENYTDRKIDEKYTVVKCKFCGKTPIIRQYDSYAGDGTLYIGCFNDESECYQQVSFHENLQHTIDMWNALNDKHFCFKPSYEVKSILAECCANCRLQDNCEAIKQIKNQHQSNVILTKLVCNDFT